MSVLVTGGTGYIGSHTCVELLESGKSVVVVDDLSNSSYKAIDRIKKIVGNEFSDNVSFYKCDILDRASLGRVFEENPDIDSVIHFAGYKAVAESCREPLKYYHNNIEGTVSLCEEMKEHKVKTIVFSSSATVYGDAEIPYREGTEGYGCSSPYGWTKSMIEQILRDVVTADPEWNVVLLRYFNPIGAHESGLIGEDPKGIPNNLMPYISRVAIGTYPYLHIYGDDYPTPDGTCRRDYLHVVDLARGHVRALEWMDGEKGVEVFNLGTGTPISVLELVREFSNACGHDIPYQFDERRSGDLPEFWADASKAKKVLGWEAEYGIAKMCEDTWKWQSNNPKGFID